ncbi:MAG: DUF11 domain-containing protein, partial [Haliscomenobacter sp.]
VLVTPGSNLGPYNNQATAYGTSTLGTSVQDDSYDGIDVDPENDGPDNNDDPTPVTFTESPQIGVAKTISAGPVNNHDGTYTLSYQIFVENTGDVALSNIRVKDSLAIVFANATSFQVLGVTATGTLTANSSFNGNSNVELLTGGTLAVGARESITLQIKVTPGLVLGTYNNKALGSGTSPKGASVTDYSQNGTAVDPDSDNQTSDNNQPTPLTFESDPQIGVAKRVSSGPTINLSDGSFRVVYKIKVFNSGDVPLSNFQVEEDLSQTFIEADSFAFKSLTGSGMSGFTVNSAFNGVSDKFLFASGQTLAYQASDSVTLAVDFFSSNYSQPYYNTAVAFGTAPNGTVVLDASQDGVDPDPDSDLSPRNNNEQTPVQVPSLTIGAAKQVLSGPTAVGDGTYTVTYQVRAKNMGGMDIYDLQLYDTLAAFGTYTASTPTQSLYYTISSAPSIVYPSSGATLTANSSFSGTGTQTSLVSLNSGDKLAVGDSLAVEFTVRFRPLKDTLYKNQVVAVGDRFENGTPDRHTIDYSNEGTDIDPNGDGIPNQFLDPNNDIFVGNNDSTEFSITLAADLALTKSSVVLPDGKVKFTITVHNYGPADAHNVTVQDSIPDGYTYLSHTSGQSFVFNAGTNLGEWTIGTIVPGADSTLDITVSLNATNPFTLSEYTNVAEVTNSSLPDPDSTPD